MLLNSALAGRSLGRLCMCRGPAPLQLIRRSAGSCYARHHCTRAWAVGAATMQTDGPQASASPYSVAAGRPVFTDWKVHKGSAAMALKFIKPRWRSTDGGGLVLDRAGSGFFEFAKAVEGTGNQPGERRYDWERRVAISLSATELGNLLAVLSTGEAVQPFYHDTHKGKPGLEGTETKQLRIDPVTQGGRGVYMNISGRKNGQETKVSVKIDAGEMEVLKSIVSFAIPKLIGLEELFAAGSTAGQADADPGSPMNTGTGAEAWKRLPSDGPPF